MSEMKEAAIINVVITPLLPRGCSWRHCRIVRHPIPQCRAAADRGGCDRQHRVGLWMDMARPIASALAEPDGIAPLTSRRSAPSYVLLNRTYDDFYPLLASHYRSGHT